MNTIRCSRYNRSQRYRGGVDVQVYTAFILGARRGEWLTPRPERFTTGNKAGKH